MRWRMPGWSTERGGSFLLSCAVHAALLFGTAGAVMQPVRYDVETGTGGMEVSLIAAPAPSAAPEAVQALPAIPEPDAAATAEDWALDPVAPPPPREAADAEPAAVEPPRETAPATPSSVVGDGSSPVPGSDPTTLYLTGGAATGKGGRFKNPAPPYPYPAIRQKQEGLVVLETEIDKAGRPLDVTIKESSGFPLLDQSALRTVRRWKFDPAHIGFLPVQSRIVIPIRFTLENARLYDAR
jgi:periplasmic protein TonB